MKARESQLATKISQARKAAESLDSSVAVYAWLSFIGCIILVIVAMATGGNWMLIGYAGSAALITWVVRSFASLQSAKLELAIAVAEVEAKARSLANSDS